jgi:hypothetical protein
LRRADVDWDDNTRSEFLAEIELETDRLAQLVDSLLTPWSVADPWLASGVSHESISAGEHVAFTDPASVLDGALHPGFQIRHPVTDSMNARASLQGQVNRALIDHLEFGSDCTAKSQPIVGGIDEVDRRAEVALGGLLWRPNASWICSKGCLATARKLGGRCGAEHAGPSSSREAARR